MLLSVYFSFAAVAGLAAAAPTKRQAAIPSGVPSYVVDYAPVVYLYSGENYFPSDIGAQLTNTHPELNFTDVAGAPSPLTLDNLSQLNSVANSSGGRDVYLTSTLDATHFPSPQYLFGVKPDATGLTPNAVSAAIVVHDHQNGTLDAYYFYFYAFNFGGLYFSLNVGNHVGDWEHNLVRFNSTAGLPTQVYYSQHSGGEAFSYAATQKFVASSATARPRPVSYSANGTHANYATPGTHDHTLPGLNLPLGPVQDYTDAGTLWDPTLSAAYYAWQPASPAAKTGAFTAYDPAAAPVDWLNFLGRWGDDQLPESDPRQNCYFGISLLCTQVAGPTGPEDKDLNRRNVCPDSQSDCNVNSVLLPKQRRGEGEEEMM